MATQTATRTTRKKTAKKAAERSVLDAIHANQEAVVDLTKKWVDSIGEIAPDLWNKQIVEGAPAIHDVTDAAFDLTRKVLDAQLEFTRRIVDSVVDEVKKIH
jgi:hypothetical protein